MRKCMAVLIGMLLISPGAAAQAASDSGDSTASQVGYGAGSVMGTLVYAPVKGAFCVLGGVSSGFAFVFGGAKAAGQVAGATCGGTWAITPDALKGKESVKFVGDTSSGKSVGSKQDNGAKSDSVAKR